MHKPKILLICPLAAVAHLLAKKKIRKNLKIEKNI
jgi:hypothetical protein